MDSTLKAKLNAIVDKAVPSGKPAVTDPAHYLDPAEFNILRDGVKANNADIEALQANPVSSKGPKVVSTDPANNALNVLSTKVITVTVDQFLFASSVNNANITLKDKDGNAVAITVSYDGAKTITINHAAGFTIPASPYALHIGTGVLNVLGEAFNNNAEYILGFSCGTDNFPSKPAISVDNVTRYSARVNLSTSSTDDMGSVSYVLAYGDGTIIADPVTLPYTFPSLLNSDTDYTVKVGAKDSAGQITWSDSVLFHTSVNQAPTASGVSISGNTTLGSLLTINATGTDADSGDTVTFTYRWLRNGVAIAGETAQTHTIVSADQGITLTGEATPVDNHGLAGTPATAQINIPVAALNKTTPGKLYEEAFTNTSNWSLGNNTNGTASLSIGGGKLQAYGSDASKIYPIVLGAVSARNDVYIIMRAGNSAGLSATDAEIIPAGRMKNSNAEWLAGKSRGGGAWGNNDYLSNDLALGTNEGALSVQSAPSRGLTDVRTTFLSIKGATAKFKASDNTNVSTVSNLPTTSGNLGFVLFENDAGHMLQVEKYIALTSSIVQVTGQTAGQYGELLVNGAVTATATVDASGNLNFDLFGVDVPKGGLMTVAVKTYTDSGKATPVKTSAAIDNVYPGDIYSL